MSETSKDAPVAEGGAVETEVEVEDVADAAGSGDTVNAVAIERGTLGPLGIVPIDKDIKNIPVEMFSSKWMKPKTAADAKKIKKYQDAGSGKQTS